MKTPIMKGASILTAILFFSMVLTPVLGGEVLPFNRWGNAYQDVAETIPLDTQTITAWVEGVSYGDTTTDGAGLFNIDTRGDTTDSTTVKTGGWNLDDVFYVHGDLTTAGIFFAEVGIFESGNVPTAAENLHYAATQPDLLKINNISVDCTLGVATDYIVIYNPTAGFVDITQYSISIGVGAPVAIAGPIAGLYAWNVNPIPAGGFFAVDMGALPDAGGALLLSHTGTAFIVDRVEYGSPAAEIDDSHPDTLLVTDNAVAPGTGNEIYRTGGPGVDTNVHIDDFAAVGGQWLPVAVLTTIVVTPNPVQYVRGDVTAWAMTAQGYDQVGGLIACAPTWFDDEGTGGYVPNPSASGSPATTIYTPGVAPLQGTYTMSAQDGTVTGTAVLQIDWGTLTTITVTPDPVTYMSTDVTPWAMQAQGYNEYLLAMPCAPTWSDTEGTGGYVPNPSALGNPATTVYTPGPAPVPNPLYSMDAQDGAIIGSAVLNITPSGAEKFAPATGLVISKSGANDLQLDWTNPAASDWWDIYGSQNKMDVLGGLLLGTVPDGTGTFTHSVGAPQTDGQDWFYIVQGRGSLGSLATNSTMVYKVTRTFNYNAALPNINWVSLPWDTSYFTTASDIVTDLEGGTGAGTNTMIDTVALWDPVTQSASDIYTYSTFPPPGGWVGSNFAITPGAGIYVGLSGGTGSFEWVQVGSDVVDTRTFNYNAALPNINWVMIPATGNYATASDIVTDIEGGIGAGTDTRISTVALWDPVTQSASDIYTYSTFPPPGGWVGSDFAITPIAGVYFGLSGNVSPFDWMINLITPVVP